jgi:hypothetical protein
MKREILNLDNHRKNNWCCPGHDKWPEDTYSKNRSKKQCAVFKTKEHRLARRIAKLELKQSSLIGERVD